MICTAISEHEPGCGFPYYYNTNPSPKNVVKLRLIKILSAVRIRVTNVPSNKPIPTVLNTVQVRVRKGIVESENH